MPNQIELFEIENPCVGVCQSNKRGYCLGCLRSRTERQLWFKMSNEQKREVLRLIIRRKKKIAHLKQRRQAHLVQEFDGDDNDDSDDSNPLLF